jgi:hypothetical protein
MGYRQRQNFKFFDDFLRFEGRNFRKYRILNNLVNPQTQPVKHAKNVNIAVET